MEWLTGLWEQFKFMFSDLPAWLGNLVETYQGWTYVILFLIIFAETGLVIFPILPGDSLLFAAGAIWHQTDLSIFILITVLFIAAVLGDALNYYIGKTFGEKLFERPNRFLKKEYLERTHAFYEKHGPKTIILARFVPIVRTFAPFVAGIGTMQYRKFFFYNVIGAFLWIVSFTVLGYFFGGIPAVKKNFTLVVFGIIGISVLPIGIEFLRHFLSKKSETK